MDMERESQSLKLYFFTVQNGPKMVEFPEDFKAVMAYNHQGAIDNIRKDYPPGHILTAKQRGQIELKEILNVISLPISETRIETPPKKEIGEKEFICSLMLVVDKFVTDKRDRTSLKRIINKIQNDETTRNSAASQDAAGGSESRGTDSVGCSDGTPKND